MSRRFRPSLPGPPLHRRSIKPLLELDEPGSVLEERPQVLDHQESRDQPIMDVEYQSEIGPGCDTGVLDGKAFVAQDDQVLALGEVLHPPEGDDAAERPEIV